MPYHRDKVSKELVTATFRRWDGRGLRECNGRAGVRQPAGCTSGGAKQDKMNPWASTIVKSGSVFKLEAGRKKTVLTKLDCVTVHNEYMIDFTGISLITALSILILNEHIDNDAIVNHVMAKPTGVRDGILSILEDLYRPVNACNPQSTPMDYVDEAKTRHKIISYTGTLTRDDTRQKAASRGNRTPGSPTLLDGNGEFYH
ncbi:uncharacterized protein CLUP02_11273 [Colletotrichum lupini]|uniref:Uncharacterized protein n=1 Tax=Colletotrichum lupini TaxID=145971 RepID=A0A9Q8SYB7_9PEZI|nr:uncharacterized protein CLUP02_11273 [Colletotrichum lupini]UQC85774.1 hypothetical protein CLUP02_11273 [Colletotrichum lupini]